MAIIKESDFKRSPSTACFTSINYATNHVHVGSGSDAGPHDGSGLERFDPEEISYE